MKVNLFYRKRNPKNFSIEGLFDNLLVALSKKTKSDGIQVEKIEVPFYSSGNPSSIWKNISFSKKNASDINHITGDVHYIALGMKREALILTVHDCVTLTVKRNPIKQWLIKKLWYDLPVNRVKYITVISEKTKKELIHYTGCNPKKITVIPNCYNQAFQYSPLKSSSEKPVILQIGTRSNKNLENVIKALETIDCKFNIIGGLTPEQESLLHKYKIDFETFEEISDKVLIDKYKEASLITFASFYEGFGMPIIEAQAIGRPVLTSNIAPMSEVAGGGAVLVNPNSVEEIKNGILKIIEDLPFREDLVAKGLENIKRFSIDSISQAYIELYKKAYHDIN